jgi:hypothetical protein
VRSDNPLRDDREEHVVPVGDHRVAIAYDPDGESWYVRTSSVPGLVAEADTADALIAELPGLIAALTLP